MDFSSSSIQMIVYTLKLLREDEYNFFLLNLPEAADTHSLEFQNKERMDCIHYEAHQKLQKFRKGVVQIFPDKKVQIQFLSSVNILKQQLDPVSLITASTGLLGKYQGQLLNRLFRATGSPLIFQPENKKFCLPKRILITLEPHVEIREVTLTPFKNLFGNHDLIVEIQRLYRGELSPGHIEKDEIELKHKFEICHPKIVNLQTKQIGDQLRRMMRQEHFDLHIMPISQTTLIDRMVSSQLKKGIVNSKIPVMILQGTQKEQSIFTRHGRKKIKTSIVP